MKVKIKNQNELIDATIEMVDGVMVVSPKESKEEKIDLSQFKEGDILYCSCAKSSWLCIYKGEAEYFGDSIYMEDYCYLNLDRDKMLSTKADYSNSATFIRHATEEEKQKLFEALAKEECEWDVKKRELVKVKWKPIIGEYVYFLGSNIAHTDIFFPIIVSYKEIYDCQYDMGRVFKTKEECQAFCNKLNEAIKNIKP